MDAHNYNLSPGVNIHTFSTQVLESVELNHNQISTALGTPKLIKEEMSLSCINNVTVTIYHTLASCHDLRWCANLYESIHLSNNIQKTEQAETT